MSKKGKDLTDLTEIDCEFLCKMVEDSCVSKKVKADSETDVVMFSLLYGLERLLMEC